MGFDNRFADGQPETHAICLCRKKRIENTVDVFRIDSGSGVFDDDC